MTASRRTELDEEGLNRSGSRLSQFAPKVVVFPMDVAWFQRHSTLDGSSPIILPGMTPTTVGPRIVAGGRMDHWQKWPVAPVIGRGLH